MRQFAIAALLCTLASLSLGEDLRKAAADNVPRGFARAMKTKDIGWFKKVAAPDFYEESRGKKTYRDHGNRRNQPNALLNSATSQTW